mgnify:FL=1
MLETSYNWELINAIKEGINQLNEDEKIIIKDYVSGKPAPSYSVGGMMVRCMIENYERSMRGEN